MSIRKGRHLALQLQTKSSTWLDPPIQTLGNHNGRPNHPRQVEKATNEALIFENPPPSEFWPSTIFHSLVMSIPNGLSPPDALETAYLSILSGLSSRFSVCQIVLPPGSRSSSPHAHSKEHHFIYIVEGSGRLWLNGEIAQLRAGDCAGFCAGTGIAHCILNDGPDDLLFLEVGQVNTVASSTMDPYSCSLSMKLRRTLMMIRSFTL